MVTFFTREKGERGPTSMMHPAEGGRRERGKKEKKKKKNGITACV